MVGAAGKPAPSVDGICGPETIAAIRRSRVPEKERNAADGAARYLSIQPQVDIHTLNEGIADQMKVGFRGMMGAAFLKDLADKVGRHHVGRVREGHVMGRVTCGYRPVQGKPGEREIDPAQAAIVQRIFRQN